MNKTTSVNINIADEEIDNLVQVLIQSVIANPDGEYYDFAMELLGYLGVEFTPEDNQEIKVH